jgi:small subunit ribosomal protein S20
MRFRCWVSDRHKLLRERGCGLVLYDAGHQSQSFFLFTFLLYSDKIFIMPITKSAQKAFRQSIRKKKINLKKKEAVKKILKEIKKLKSEGKTEEVLKLLSRAYKAIDKAAKRGVIKKRTASRKKSRLMKFLKK